MLTGDGLIVRPATPADLQATARAHISMLPAGLFPALGPRFVRHWHRTFLDSPHGVAFVMVDPRSEGVIGGFLLGTSDQARFTSALLADRRSMATLVISGTAALSRRPRLGLHFLRTRARPWARRLLRRRPAVEASTGAVPEQPERLAVLSAVAVHPTMQGRGVGERLVEQFLAQARRAGASTALLVTEIGQDGAAGFYDRLGWTAVRDRTTRDGTAVRIYRHPVHGPQ